MSTYTMDDVTYILDPEGNKLMGYRVLNGRLHYHIYTAGARMYTDYEGTITLHYPGDDG